MLGTQGYYYDDDEDVDRSLDADRHEEALSERVADKLVDLLEEAYSLVYGSADSEHAPEVSRLPGWARGELLWLA